MFERIAIQYLRQWAKKEDRKPLVLRGARQVGKTTLVKLFFFQGGRSRQCFPDIRENAFVGVGISSNFCIFSYFTRLEEKS